MWNVFRVAIVLIGLLPGAPNAFAAGEAAAYALVDHTTGYVLESYKGMDKRPIGTLAKVAAAKVVLDWAAKTNTDLAQEVAVPPTALGVSGINPMGLQPGDLITYRDLLYAALLQSDNTATATLGYYVGSALRGQGGVGGRELDANEAFVSQMNALARQLGAERTLFVNPEGVEPAKGLQPYSTALDLARLAAYAMKDPAFRFYVSQKERKVAFRRGPQVLQYLLRNTNELLGTNGIDGVKTGRSARAGDCLILSSQHDPEIRQEGGTTLVTPRRVEAVVLAAQSRFDVANRLLTRARILYDQWAAAGRPAQALR